MKKLKISTLLIILTIVSIVGLLAVGFNGLSALSASNAALKTVYEDRTVAIGQLSAIQTRLFKNYVGILNATSHGTDDEISSATTNFQKNSEFISSTWTAYMATTLTEEEKVLAKAFFESRTDLVQNGFTPVLKSLAGKNIDEAKIVSASQIQPKFEAASKALLELSDLQLKVAKNEFEVSQQNYEATRNISLALFLGSMSLSAMLSFGLIKIIRADLLKAQVQTDQMAKGDLSRPLENDGKNEIGQVLLSLSAMQVSLGEVVQSVRDSAEATATASAEIAQGNQDLSARTENQASSLEETAAAMEELSSTVQQNAEHARSAVKLATEASKIASVGGDNVASVVQTMAGINESSKKISDIISVIDGIAFQTNILALNAAVEAARAGDQGLGFAVVAKEVRSLATRSAEAAKQIKGLITESMAFVTKGSSQVQVTGKTMQEVVSSIQAVADLIASISLASDEQSAGVSQIGEAIVSLDQVTQQNAALVEQMAAAAASLNSQAAELVATVSIFKL